MKVQSITDHLKQATVPDLLRAYQSALSREYECATCGEWKPGSELNDFLIRDAGDEQWWMICKDCQAKRRHQLFP